MSPEAEAQFRAEMWRAWERWLSNPQNQEAVQAHCDAIRAEVDAAVLKALAERYPDKSSGY